jgi:Holliday junction resolvasome RuvABC ATP-dependent DNA helicase subunit
MTSSAIRNRKPNPKDLEAIEALEEQERPALKEAEEQLAKYQAAHPPPGAEAVAQEGPPQIPPDLFDEVEDHAGVKKLLMAALHSARPVHVLLVGPPASGKTQLLQAIAKLPQSRYATGPTISTSGMFSYLLEHPQTRFLIIDEIEKADRENLYLLLTLMQSGKITRLKHAGQEEADRIVWVFAAANSTQTLPEALLSRFVRVDIKGYSVEQVSQITEAVLVRQEGLSRPQARKIAEMTAARSRDPRAGIQVGQLSRTMPPEEALEQVIPSKSA